MKITKAAWEALSDTEKVKYEPSPDNADEYVLKAQAPPPSVSPQPKDEKAVGITREQADAEIQAAVTAATTAARTAFEKEEADKAAIEKGEYQKLYEEMKPKYEALEKEVTTLGGLIDSEIETRAAKLPDNLKKLYEIATDRDTKLTFLRNAGDIKGDLNDPPDPPPDEARQSTKEAKESAMAARQSTGVYS